MFFRLLSLVVCARLFLLLLWFGFCSLMCGPHSSHPFSFLFTLKLSKIILPSLVAFLTRCFTSTSGDNREASEEWRPARCRRDTDTHRTEQCESQESTRQHGNPPLPIAAVLFPAASRTLVRNHSTIDERHLSGADAKSETRPMPLTAWVSQCHTEPAAQHVANDDRDAKAESRTRWKGNQGKGLDDLCAITSRLRQ